MGDIYRHHSASQLPKRYAQDFQAAGTSVDMTTDCNVDDSAPNPGGMEFPELERCQVPHRICRLLQHVCASECDNRVQHIPVR